MLTISSVLSLVCQLFSLNTSKNDRGSIATELVSLDPSHFVVTHLHDSGLPLAGHLHCSPKFFNEVTSPFTLSDVRPPLSSILDGFRAHLQNVDIELHLNCGKNYSEAWNMLDSTGSFSDGLCVSKETTIYFVLKGEYQMYVNLKPKPKNWPTNFDPHAWYSSGEEYQLNYTLGFVRHVLKTGHSMILPKGATFSIHRLPSSMAAIFGVGNRHIIQNRVTRRLVTEK
jgi:hypothetical protein